MGQRFLQLQNANFDPEVLKDLYAKLCKLQLIEGTHLKTLTHGAMIDCANIIQKIT